MQLIAATEQSRRSPARACLCTLETLSRNTPTSPLAASSGTCPVSQRLIQAIMSSPRRSSPTASLHVLERFDVSLLSSRPTSCKKIDVRADRRRRIAKVVDEKPERITRVSSALIDIRLRHEGVRTTRVRTQGKTSTSDFASLLDQSGDVGENGRTTLEYVSDLASRSGAGRSRHCSGPPLARWATMACFIEKPGVAFDGRAWRSAQSCSSRVEKPRQSGPSSKRCGKRAVVVPQDRATLPRMASAGKLPPLKRSQLPIKQIEHAPCVEKSRARSLLAFRDFAPSCPPSRPTSKRLLEARPTAFLFTQ